MKALFVAASAAFSSMPGLLVVASGLGTPPDHRVLFGGVIEAFGVIALLVLWVNNGRIKKMKTRVITRTAIALALGSLMALFSYIYLFNKSVVNVEGRGTAYYPLYLTGAIRKTVEYNGGSRKSAIENEGLATILEEIDQMPDFYLTMTTIVLLAIYQLIFTTLATTFGILGFHKGKGLGRG